MQCYMVDVFADRRAHGNPAAVCVVEGEWPDDRLLMDIAFENNAPVTAFLRTAEEGFDLRWFNLKHELELCGHATLGAAYVAMTYLKPGSCCAKLHTKGGLFRVHRDESGIYTMDFPSRRAKCCPKPELLEYALGAPVLKTFIARDLVAVVENEDVVAHLRPDVPMFSQLRQCFGVIVTAKGRDCDFVSRFFSPLLATGTEDAVTAVAHSTLIPFWSERLGKQEMIARQLSARGGTIYCKNTCCTRVHIGGHVVTHSIGTIIL